MKPFERNFFCTCAVALVLLVPVHNAPRHRSKGHLSAKFNQSQSGDYNFQVNLKDFYIAVLDEGVLGGLGDYDYNYDYSDLTVKPSLPSTTANPESPNNASTIPAGPEATSQNSEPYPMISPATTHGPLENPPSTTSQASPSSTPGDNSSTSKPALVNSSENSENADKSTTQKSDMEPNSAKPSSEDKVQEPQKSDMEPSSSKPSSEEKVQEPQKSDMEPNSAKPLAEEKVQEPQKSDVEPNSAKPLAEDKVQEPQKSTKAENSPEAVQQAQEKKTESSVTNVSIVPLENSETGQNGQRIPLGEIMHYRKCAQGYSKDKQGRCRKIRRRTSQQPIDIKHFAANLFSRFRQATRKEGALSQAR